MHDTHHIEDKWLFAYSAGTLPEALTLAVATHIAMCETCRESVRTFDALGGDMLLSADLEMDTDVSLASIFERAQDIEAADASRPITPKQSNVPAPIAEYIGGDLNAIRWRSIGLGAKQAIICDDGASTARLLYIPSGMALPDHGHDGTEMTVVLQGAFWDGDQRFGVGDVQCATDEIEHQPIADIGEDCICLAATDAPLRFKGFLPRLIQPLLRI